MKLNVNRDTVIKKCETLGIKYKDCECFFEYTNFKDNLMETNVYVVVRMIKNV